MPKFRPRARQIREPGRKREWIDPTLAAEAEIQREREAAAKLAEEEDEEYEFDEMTGLWVPRGFFEIENDEHNS
jgi:hypothetical protein